MPEENKFETGKITLWLDDVQVGTETTLNHVEIPNTDYNCVIVGNGATVSGLTIESGGMLLMDKEAEFGGLILGGTSSSSYNGGVYQGGGIARDNTGWYGAAICASTANVTLTDALFENNTVDALNGFNGLGGAIEAYAGVLSITDSIFNKNSAGGSTAAGGAVCAINGAVVTVSCGSFAENEAAYGGALQQWGGTLSIDGTVFEKNYARIGGGALEMHGGVTAGVVNAVFTENSAVHGGAVYNDTYYGAVSDLTIDGSEFTENIADLGGAVYNYADLIIRKSDFTGNCVNMPIGWETDKGYGGAIANTISGDLTIEESFFTSNIAQSGGAVANWINYGESGFAEMTICKSVFEKNTAEYGGAVYQSGAFSDTVTIIDSAFSENSAGYGGGAVVNVFGKLMVDGGSFTKNSAVNDGGAIALWNGGTVENAEFTQNSAAYGGAISNSWSTPEVTVTGCVFSGNTASVSGGAIWNDSNGCEIITIDGCTFTGNTATVSGGAVFNGYKMTLKDSSFTTATDTVYNRGTLILRGNNSFAAKVDNTDGTLIFDLSSHTGADGALVDDLSCFSEGGIYMISVKSTQTAGSYQLASSGAEAFRKMVLAVVDENGTLLDRIRMSDPVGRVYSFMESDGGLFLNVGKKMFFENTADFSEDAGSLEFSLKKDDSSAIRILLESGNSVSTYNLPDTILFQTVKDQDGQLLDEMEELQDTVNPDGENRIIAAADDGRSDIFFVRETDAVWEERYRGKHLGCKGMWDGTGETVGLVGKNRIEDLFNGAVDDVAVLYLTDTDNGDTLFVDDIFGGSYQNIARDHARLANLDEIRAGNGDDLVDLTSRQFEYQGDGLTVRGGNGNDTIWANHGENKLFGDAGNDRIVGASGNDWIIGGTGNDSMHGGGGDDIFTFCDQWGNDVVEQLEGGNVTLWFLNGSLENWDAGKMLYSDGVNSVQVIGADTVNLKFGDNGSDLFASLAACGAFLAESSRNIFEENGVDKIYITL